MSRISAEEHKDSLPNSEDFAKTQHRLLRLAACKNTTTTGSPEIYIWLDVFGLGYEGTFFQRSGFNFTLAEYYKMVREHTGATCELQNAAEGLEKSPKCKYFPNIGQLYDMSVTPDQDSELFDFSIDMKDWLRSARFIRISIKKYPSTVGEQMLYFYFKLFEYNDFREVWHKQLQIGLNQTEFELLKCTTPRLMEKHIDKVLWDAQPCNLVENSNDDQRPTLRRSFAHDDGSGYNSPVDLSEFING
jgi:hypothetical protein